jgi:hypothetical protein
MRRINAQQPGHKADEVPLTAKCMHNIIGLHIHLEARMTQAARRRSEPIAADEAELPRKKNYRLLQSKIDRAMQILGTRTETEAIEQALDMIAFQDEMLASVDTMYGAGVVNVFDEEPGAEVRH